MRFITDLNCIKTPNNPLNSETIDTILLNFTGQTKKKFSFISSTILGQKSIVNDSSINHAILDFKTLDPSGPNLFIFPYHSPGHWQIIIIDLDNSRWIWYDPLVEIKEQNASNEFYHSLNISMIIVKISILILLNFLSASQHFKMIHELVFIDFVYLHYFLQKKLKIFTKILVIKKF